MSFKVTPEEWPPFYSVQRTGFNSQNPSFAKQPHLNGQLLRPYPVLAIFHNLMSSLMCD